ncbi:MAG: HIT domain-containing protein [Candidatus Thermoplasmatota archaeon]|jgi:diadenosine tetraphosphate (Ap4A) HIT family hydrolase|nr:HIT domain-containing protein [Candidatus Thermoplasmatota archaeon]MCL5964103.1 HIT domain-containing protein [Candidatus Thermoplasmatota archaeon]
MSNSCVFCDIIKKTAEGYIVYESDRVIAFLDKYPITKGHILVVPVKHYERFIEMEQVDRYALIDSITIITKKVEKLTDNYNIGMNQGEYAGQIISHIHFHIIPRYPNDERSFNHRTILKDSIAMDVVNILTKM